MSSALEEIDFIETVQEPDPEAEYVPPTLPEETDEDQSWATDEELFQELNG